jgi:hypothetical protein
MRGGELRKGEAKARRRQAGPMTERFSMSPVTKTFSSALGRFSTSSVGTPALQKLSL